MGPQGEKGGIGDNGTTGRSGLPGEKVSYIHVHTHADHIGCVYFLISKMVTQAPTDTTYMYIYII